MTATLRIPDSLERRCAREGDRGSDTRRTPERKVAGLQSIHRLPVGDVRATEPDRPPEELPHVPAVRIDERGRERETTVGEKQHLAGDCFRPNDRKHRPERQHRTSNHPAAVQISPRGEDERDEQVPARYAVAEPLRITSIQQNASSENTCGRMWLACANVPIVAKTISRSRARASTCCRESATQTPASVPSTAAILRTMRPAPPPVRYAR